MSVIYASIAKSSRAEDNSFPPTAFYLRETTPLSLHFGELRLPAFLDCHPEAGAFRSLKDLGEPRERRGVCDAIIAHWARFIIV